MKGWRWSCVLPAGPCLRPGRPVGGGGGGGGPAWPWPPGRLRHGDFAAAAEAFARAHAVAPNLASAAFCLDAALAARLAGQPGRAAFWLRRAVLAAPGDPETTAALAAAGFDAGDVFAGPWFLSGWLPARSLWLTALWAKACFCLSLAAGRLFGRPVPGRRRWRPGWP